MKKNDVFSIRPAGRHILTIGRDLIQDSHAAVVELVKNAFDADSGYVKINFTAKKNNESCEIKISDSGHGMSREDVIDRWLVPSTSDKLRRKKSPKGRILQGRKGVGRFAASILGVDLLLETSRGDGSVTSVYIEWDSFEKAKYLDEVELLIETRKRKQKAGTTLTIKCSAGNFEEWTEQQFRQLMYELRKLIPPKAEISGESLKQERFDIHLKINGFDGVRDTDEVIKPFPILELYDYRISGSLDEMGQGKLLYSTQKIENASHEEIEVDYYDFLVNSCGKIHFDIRVYDRDKSDIDQLIKRGLKDQEGNFLGNLETRQLLNLNNGIGVYRNGFRIRPLGDAQFDWLKLNEKRIQNPSRKIGGNQVIGFVHIESEENSNLIEKSARDGLKETPSYKRLIELTQNVIVELETRRFALRESLELGRPKARVEKQLSELFSNENIREDIVGRLEKAGISKKVTQEVSEIISRDNELKNKAAESIRKTVAVYQGQATLGKIMNVVLHEGRRPLHFFKNQIPILNKWGKEFEKTPTPINLSRVYPIALELEQNAEVLAKLFDKLDPLAVSKRSNSSPVSLTKSINVAMKVFEKEILESGVEIEVTGPKDFKLIGWQTDLYAIFVNLIDNSLYWLKNKNINLPKITIRFEINNESLAYIDYRDNGPGIDKSLIESEIIFDPEFSTKPDGTGLGLAIAGEAASRNGLELNVLDSEYGAYFRLQRLAGEEK